MANTFTLIASNTLSATTTSFTFSSIPDTYTDLVLKASVRQTDANWNGELKIVFNSDTTTKYSATSIDGVGTSVSSANVTSNTSVRFIAVDGTATANTFSNTELYIPSYLSTLSKPSGTFTVVENNSATQNYVRDIAQLYRGSSAISSMTISAYTGGESLLSGSSFYLYGIKSS